ncbi:thioredoxin fold domain-containing protein [Deinococcus soli (ex Cha et al. 2016)]|uniref:Glutaredoxin n=2 Tax=Deinococcus soli (ex Cha et al. 2016) TaxID=1309411 RepID=A0ACC6KFV0_9DEIO|nr:thioredoxin fold domain-containing protein [Deinococcus soli (ex Cha et al. 2016)]MDR6218248.1 glutaredoxin [Deinococcus soli (ex Cha et al. 2016)]MDR6328988.1 glutaredoxin [Deinococcus soli (ex Cha et al. 2016)]MDR6751261.1 glutaredoxin [Deinococcus soli (ex Cha et al. 2016)]
MPEPTVTLLTQDDCPSCERLKRMLAQPLKGQYDARVRTVHRQRDPDAFAALSAQHDVRATPALIHTPSGAALRVPSGLGEVKAFLDAHT